MAPTKFKTQLEASSYHAPGGGELYKPLREKIVKQAIEQGYDEATMIEHGVIWADGEYLTPNTSHFDLLQDLHV